MEILAIGLVLLATEDRGGRALSLASGQISQHVEDLEQIGKEHLKAVALTFSLGPARARGERVLPAGVRVVPLTPGESPKRWKSTGMIIL